MEEKKYNWFSIEGDIRTKEPMTLDEFTKLLDDAGLEWVGQLGSSDIKDEDYK